MLEIEKYLYHGLNYSHNDIETLEKIFSSGYIMTRDSLKEYLSFSEMSKFLTSHKANWNGLDAVSIACHPKNLELIEKYNITKPSPPGDNAYEEFIFGSTTLILDPSLLEDFKQKEISIKMGYEVQILGDIPISYIKAIAIRADSCYNTFSPKNIYRLKSVLNELKQLNKGKNFVSYYGITQTLRETFITKTLEEIYDKCIFTNFIPKIRKLLDSYNLDIPVIDLDYGYELPSLEKQKKRIKKLRKQYDDYNKFKNYNITLKE